MRRIALIFLLLSIIAPPCRASAQPQPAMVVLISIDGLKPDYVLEADRYGLKIPNLRRLAREGAYSTGVEGVLPTVTYPSHTTMVTGVAPSKHGIIANTPFDPYGKNMNGWYWYAQDIKTPTLWDAASKAGIVTASLDWPVTVGANIRYNIVQYWRAETPDDKKIIRALSTPGLFDEAEAAVGPYPEGNDYTVAADRRRARFAAYVIEKKKPGFITCYFSGLDTDQHDAGPYSGKAFAGLEEIDSLVGLLRAAAERARGRAYVCVVSDHGFIQTDKVININSALREAGLATVDEKGKLKSWRAIGWYAGGSLAVMLANKDDAEAREKTREVLKRLAADPANGLHRVIESSEAERMGGFAGAAFVLCAKTGYRFGNDLTAPVAQSGRPGGTHGYFPELKEMDASFLIAGPGIAPKNLGRIRMIDIAPTLAGLMKVKLPTADGRNVIE
ncbi:MAG: ectonucleotide pyrophosphatase/phosphodiesterase [Acidobacteriota bacterium]